MPALFEDRQDAGRRLAAALEPFGRDGVVLGLPRGGVVVAREVAQALGEPLDVFVVRKIGAPMQPELAIGALAETGQLELNADLIRMLGITQETVDEIVAREREEIDRRLRLYRGGRPLTPLAGRIAIVVDDGVATGFTTLAAARALRKERPERLVLAVPVCPAQTVSRLAKEVDEFVYLAAPEPFVAVGAWYSDFSQVDDAEVQLALAEAPNEA